MAENHRIGDPDGRRKSPPPMMICVVSPFAPSEAGATTTQTAGRAALERFVHGPLLLNRSEPLTECDRGSASGARRERRRPRFRGVLDVFLEEPSRPVDMCAINAAANSIDGSPGRSSRLLRINE